MYGALMALDDEITAALKYGEKVELGSICIFYPNLSSEGAATDQWLYNQVETNVIIRVTMD